MFHHNYTPSTAKSHKTRVLLLPGRVLAGCNPGIPAPPLATADDEREAEAYTKEYLMLHPELSRVSLSERTDGFLFFHFHRPGILVCKE